MPPRSRSLLRVDVSAATFMRGLGVALLAWVWLRLWHWVLVFMLAAFLAIALDPVVQWFERHGIRRAYAAPFLVLLIVAALVCFALFSGAELVAQADLLRAQFEGIRDRVTGALPRDLQEPASQSGTTTASTYVESAGRALVGGVAETGVALAAVVYLLLDGRRTYDWFVAFAPAHAAERVQETANAARGVIVAYVRGNVTTSIIASVVTWLVLSALHVPAALLLALLAGILNFVPVIGLFLSAIPAVLLGFSVSPTAGLAVFAFYALYNVLENYYIQPKVYGREMRLSDLAVIAGFLAGAELGGVLGALVALPVVAMYPVIEQVWKRPAGEKVAVEHRRVESEPAH